MTCDVFLTIFLKTLHFRGIGAVKHHISERLKADFEECHAFVDDKSHHDNFIILKHRLCTVLMNFNEISKLSECQ